MQENSINICVVDPDNARKKTVSNSKAKKTPEKKAKRSPISPLYVGDIIKTDPDTSTVHVGIPLEKPMHKKVPRRWDPHQPAPSFAESGCKRKLVYNVDNKKSNKKVKVVYNELDLKQEDFVNYGSDQDDDEDDDEDDAYGFLQSPRIERIFYDSLDDVDAPTDNNQLSKPSSSADSTGPPPSTPAPSEYKIYKKLIENDPNDDEDDNYGFLQYPRSKRIFNDSLDDVDAPMDYILLSKPSSTSDPTGPPPSTSAPSVCAASAQPSSSTPVSLNETTYGPHSLGDFVWESLPKPAIPPQQRREKFTAASVGPVSSFSSPYEAFVSIWDRSIMEYIAVETNRYAEQTLEAALSKGCLGGFSRKLLFTDTDADELYVFFALIIATGIVYKSDLTEYWSVNGDVFDTPNFSHYMSYTRFIAIAQMLHFVNNDVDTSHLSKSDAKIAKIAPIVKHLNEKFQAFYQLGQCIALDESLTQWKGCLSINQLIKNKVASKGIKTYEVCDSSSGYLWRFKIHAGRNEEENHELGYTTSLVLELLKGLENKGHTIFMDNYYNSPILARLLKSQGFDCAGTLRLNRQHVPVNLKALVKQPLADGSVHGVTSGDVDILVWKDRKMVSLMSTYHGAASASRDGKLKPTLVHDYNVRMGGVDKKDQMLSAYPIERKRTAVWYKKFFRRLLNTSVLNTFILHKESRAPEHPHPHLTNHRQFRKNLVKDILAKHSQRRALEPLHSASPTKVKFSAEMLRHLPKEFPFNEKLKQRKRGSCSVCRKRTQFQCIGCNAALCLDSCFAKYHS